MRSKILGGFLMGSIFLMNSCDSNSEMNSSKEVTTSDTLTVGYLSSDFLLNTISWENLKEAFNESPTTIQMIVLEDSSVQINYTDKHLMYPLKYKNNIFYCKYAYDNGESLNELFYKLIYKGTIYHLRIRKEYFSDHSWGYVVIQSDSSATRYTFSSDEILGFSYDSVYTIDTLLIDKIKKLANKKASTQYFFYDEKGNLVFREDSKKEFVEPIEIRLKGFQNIYHSEVYFEEFWNNLSLGTIILDR